MTDQNPCCDEYRGTSRRGFLRGSLVAGGAAALTVAHGAAFTQTSYAAAGSPTRSSWCCPCVVPATG